MRLPEVPESNKTLVNKLPIVSYLFPFEVLLADEGRFPFIAGVDEINQARYGSEYQMNMRPSQVNYTGLFILFGVVGKGLFWAKRLTPSPNICAYMRSLGLNDGDTFIIVNGYSPVPDILGSTTLHQHATKLREIRKKEKETVVVKKKRKKDV